MTLDPKQGYGPLCEPDSSKSLLSDYFCPLSNQPLLSGQKLSSDWLMSRFSLNTQHILDRGRRMFWKLSYDIIRHGGQ